MSTPNRHTQLSTGLLLVSLGLSASSAQALDGPHPNAATPQTLKVPDGPGSIRGLSDDPQVSAFSGQASYEVPIELPAGARGLAPSLRLSYNGGLGNGPYGLGWSLGMAEIVRSTADGVPHFDGSDELMLHGFGAPGRLIRLADGTYRVEGRGNDIKVKFEAGGFSVWDADGTQYRLGTAAGSRKVDPAAPARIASWRVNEVRDPEGQRILFTYKKDRGQLYLERVTWGPDQKMELQVALVSRPDPVVSFMDGFRVETALRVQNLTVRAFGQTVRSYALQYCSASEPREGNTCGELSVSRLVGIRMLGGNGVDSLPPLSFDYASGDDPSVKALTGVGSYRLNVGGVSMLDVDGDGASDLVRMENGAQSYRRNLGGGFGPEVSLPGSTASLFDVRIADVEGRARPNLIAADGVTQWSVYRLSSGGWQTPTRWAGTEGLRPGGAGNVMADINGDGRVDLMRVGTSDMFWHRGEENGLAAPVRVVPATGETMPTSDTQWLDMNGDGLADTVELTVRGLQVSFGRGDGRFEAPLFVRFPASLEGIDIHNLRFGDMNRDGLTDLSLVSARSVRMYAGVPGPAMFRSDFRELAGPEDTDANAVVVLADANGNGSLDFVWSSANGMWLIDLAGPTTAGLLRSVYNGMGKDVGFEYAATAELAREAEIAGSPWQAYMPASIPVITERSTRPSANGAERTTEYQVRDAFWDGAENTFGGFLQARVLTRDLDGSVDAIVDTRFHPGDGALRVLRGNPVVVEERNADGAMRTRTVNTWTALAPSDLDNTQPLLKKAMLTKKVVAHHEVLPGQPAAVVNTSVSYQFDGQRRIIAEINDGKVGVSGDEVIVERKFADNDALWIRNRVCEEKMLTGSRELVSHVRAYFGQGSTVQPLCEVGRGFAMRSEALLQQGGTSRWITLVNTQYDANGNAVVVEEKGSRREIAYDPSGLQPIQETLLTGNGQTLVTQATWDMALGVMTSTTDPAGVVTRLNFDSLGRIVSKAIGNAAPHIYYEYDWERDFPRTYTFSFDREHGNALMAVAPRAATWSPQSGFRMEVSITNGQREERLKAVARDANGWLVSEFVVRDHAGRPAFVARPFELATTALESTLRDDIDAVASARSGTRLTYDAAGRVVQKDLPTGGVNKMQYGAFHIRTSSSDMADVTLTLDGQQRTIRSERSVNGITESVDTTYSAAGHITELSINGGAVRSKFTYDTLGRMVAAHDPDVGARTFVYDDAGNLLSSENGEGQVVSFTYDAAGRLSGEDHDGVPQARYFYGKAGEGAAAGFVAGRVARAEDDFQLVGGVYKARGGSTMRYDALGRIVGQTRTVRGQTLSETVTLSASGLDLGHSFDDGFSYTQERDTAGRLVAIPGVWRAEELGADGSVQRESYANGVTRTLSQDQSGLPTSIAIQRGAQSLYDVVATRSLSGTIERLTDTDHVGLDHSASFTYDRGMRLTAAKLGVHGPGDVWEHAFAYAYDGLQNMTSRVAAQAGGDILSGLYRYGERGQGPRQLTSIQTASGTTAYTYDQAGRQTVAGGDLHQFDAADKLVSATAGGATVNYVYGHDGSRILATGGDVDEIWFSGSVVQRGLERDHYIAIDERLVARFRVNLAARRLASASTGAVSAGAPTETLPVGLAFASLLGLVLALGFRENRRVGFARAVLSPVLASAILVGPVLTNAGCSSSFEKSMASVGESAAALSGGEAPIYMHGGFGAGPALLTGASGEVLSERRFEPFGAPLEEAKLGAERSGVDFSVDPFTSLNQPVDTTTGLTFHGARWFSPESGRWLSADPPLKAPSPRWSAQPGGLNPYQYVNNEPNGHWDPDGRDLLNLPEVQRGSDRFNDLFVDYNISMMTATPDQNGNIDKIVIQYNDGRRRTVSLKDISVTYKPETHGQYRARMHEAEKDIAARTGQNPEDIHVVGTVRAGGPAKGEPGYEGPRIRYYDVGGVVMPWDTKTNQWALNHRETPNLVSARLTVDLHVFVRRTNLEAAEMAYSFAEILGWYKGVKEFQGDVMWLKSGNWNPQNSD